jgi:hypothetical protein
MKIRRRAHPTNPTYGTTKPRPGSVGTKRLPTRNRMGASMDWPLYNAQGELVDRAAIQAKVAARTAANRVQAAANGTLKVEPEQPKVAVAKVEAPVVKTLSPLQAFKQQYRNAPWFISAKGATNGHDSVYLTAADSAKEDEIPTTFQGVQVRITYVRRGAR